MPMSNRDEDNILFLDHLVFAPTLTDGPTLPEPFAVPHLLTEMDFSEVQFSRVQQPFFNDSEEFLNYLYNLRCSLATGF